MLTYSFDDDFPFIDITLQVIKINIFENEPLLVYQPNWTMQMEHVVERYNIVAEEEEDSCNIDISESKGLCKVQVLKIYIPKTT